MALDPRFDLKTVDGATIPLFMSFGLLNTLVKILKDPEGVFAIPFDHELRDQFLTSLIQNRNATGRVIDDGNKLEDMQLTPEMVCDLMAWAQEHVLDFFLSQAEKLRKLSDRHVKIAQALTPSTPG